MYSVVNGVITEQCIVKYVMLCNMVLCVPLQLVHLAEFSFPPVLPPSLSNSLLPALH